VKHTERRTAALPGCSHIFIFVRKLYVMRTDNFNSLSELDISEHSTKKPRLIKPSLTIAAHHWRRL